MKEPRVVYAVPEGWSLALCIDDGRLYFVKPYTSKLAEAKPEAWKRIRKNYGELVVAESVYDYRRGLLYLPPPRSVLLRFSKVVEEVDGFRVCRGGGLV